jgi:hypothetical protein
MNNANLRQYCAICFDGVKMKQKVAVLDCAEVHIYHERCLTKYVDEGVRRCPLCAVGFD